MDRKKKILKSSKGAQQKNTLKKLELSQKNPLNGVLYSQKYFEILKQRQQLPAFQTKKVFLELLEKNDIIIIQGETGSGKTTQIPQFLLKTLYTEQGLVAVTQPRRIAAISVAQRVSEETDTILGEIIGYSVRFDERSSSQTQIKYMTDGMLIRELMIDNSLQKFSTVILDEAHERTLNTDILMGVLKQLVEKRSNTENPLKLIVMSATIEIERFQQYFENEAPILQIPGRQYPVEIFYTPEPEEDYLEASIRTAIQIHLHEEEGDILLFLTGEEEIEYAVNKIALEIDHYQEEADPVVVYPLYGALSSNDQQKVFQKLPHKYRKIVVATNIAETSVTIDGIIYVIDSGLQKQKIYNPRMKYESLLVAPISKASAKQRTGRAGRTQPGKCYRLYTESTYKKELKDYSIPDVLRSELSSTILQLLVLGVDNVISFDFMDPPSPETMSRSLETLVYLKAIDPETGKITKLGRILGLFPLEPRIASVLVKSKQLKCEQEVLNAVSIINSGNWRLRPKDKSALADMAHKKFSTQNNCDLYSANLALQTFMQSSNKKQFCYENFLNYRTLQNAQRIKNQLQQILYNCKIDEKFDKLTKKANLSQRFKLSFLNGYFQQVAYYVNSNIYKIFNEHHQVLIHPSTFLKNKPKWVLYIEFVLTSKNFIRTVSEIDPEWLIITYPQVFNSKKITNKDSKQKLEKIEKYLRSK